MTKKEIIENWVETTDERNLDFLYDLLNLPMFVNKKQMIEFCKKNLEQPDILQSYDTAFPVDYFNNIADIYPGIVTGEFVFDYTKNRIGGELVNINNLFTQTILKFIKNK